jgi:hemolysin D
MMSVKHRFSAVKELLARYSMIFSHAWRELHSVKSGLFNEHEAEFMPAALALQEKPISKSARLTAWVLMSMVVIVILWSIFGEIDISVNAIGRIIPLGYTKTIASVDVASVRALHVEEGQTVKAGDVLIELDTSSSDAERDKATGDAQVAELQIARSRALIHAVDTLTPPKLPKIIGIENRQWQIEQSHLTGQYQDFKSKLERFNGQITHYAQDLPLATQRAKDYKALSLNHDVSDHDWSEKEQARIELEGQLTDSQHQRDVLISETKKDAYDALTQGAKDQAANTKDAKKASDHSKLLQLKAPVDGTVQQLTVHTIGGVVQSAQPLMLIVPKQNKVEVEAFVENKDIGFIHEGQVAQIKIDAFDYTKYGTIPAIVTHVSRDAIEDGKQDHTNQTTSESNSAKAENSAQGLRYSVKIILDRTSLNVDGEQRALTNGMSVNAEVKTGTRRVIEYILSPLIRHEHETLHER